MAKDTDVAGKHGRERKRDLGDGTTADVAIGADSAGNVYDATNPQLFEETDTKLPFKSPAVSSTYGEDLHAVNGAFAGTPLKMYDGTDNALGTAIAIVGPGNFDAASTEQNHTDPGTKSAKWTTPNVGDTIEITPPGGPVDLSNYVALTFWVWISTGYSTGDTIVAYFWDGALVGVEVDIAPLINILQPGSWQLVDLPLAAMGAAASTITSMRLRYKAKVGQAPTAYFDDFWLQETSGEELFFIIAPPGFEMTITHLSGVILGTNAIAPLVDPNTLLDGPALTNGVLVNVFLGGVPAPIQAVLRDFCDFSDNDFSKDGEPFHGGGSSCVKIMVTFGSPLKLSTPAGWVLGDPLLDFFLITVRDNLTIYDRFRVAGYGGLKPLPPV